MPRTYGELLARAVAALDALVETASPVEDEWQYVADMRTVWAGTLGAFLTPMTDVLADPEHVAAVNTLADLAAEIVDPHRAIDWLSTLPQAVLVAVGGPA